MKRITRRTVVIAPIAGAVLAHTAPALAQTPVASPEASPVAITPLAEATTLKVGATPVPHAEILQFVQDNLTEGTNLTVEIVEFTDYVQPNTALEDGELDANYFQHLPYLNDFNAEHGTHLVPVVAVHIEPLGIYSTSIDSLDQLKDGATVAIPNDVTNGGRALKLLAANGLITLDEGVDNPTVDDITDNPKDLDIVELEAAQLPRSLEDTDISVINGNYAIEAGYTPATDALALESGEDNPYANYLVTKEGREGEPAIVLLGQLLTSPEVKQHILDTYKGGVLPAF
ncbi:MAG TPA: MetQ/NlpA family ABC transporter substrate-binding protein [Thermomicrobiales bacterium]|jgi:D-methionine transport system substrate-binding protein|nr:MetQ/NlpA family ABC transporter substrate-binding protein [Thermomicrobiales bacterium]